MLKFKILYLAFLRESSFYESFCLFDLNEHKEIPQNEFQELSKEIQNAHFLCPGFRTGQEGARERSMVKDPICIVS